MYNFKHLHDAIPCYIPIEIKLGKSDDFLRIRETLTRIGVGSFVKKTLFQTCHIIHEKGKYYIMHFHEMNAISGKPVHLHPEDLRRRNSIAKLIEEWKLCKIVSPLGELSQQRVRIIPYKEKSQWTLMTKLDQNDIGSRQHIG